MSTILTGSCDYVNVLGPTLMDRAAFDGSVPYSIATAAYLNWMNAGSSAATVEARFCLNGSPGHYSITSGSGIPLAMNSALTRQCAIRLRDMYVGVPENASDFIVNIYVGDPSDDAPPEVSAVNTHLSFHNFAGSMIKIPDMDGIIVAAGLNVIVSIKMKIPVAPSELVAFHSVCDIDD